MPKPKKQEKFKNVLESLDQFTVEHNFGYTSKEAKGTIVGFVFSTIFTVLMVGYTYKRIALFYTHDEDSKGSYKVVQNFDELGKIDLGETGFSMGVLLDTAYPQLYGKVFDSDEALFQYIDVYSVNQFYGPLDVVGEGKPENKRRLERGCNQFNNTKFTRSTRYKAKYCVDEEAGYDFQGNFDTNPMRAIQIEITRCQRSSTQICKSDGEIDQFVNYLTVVSSNQENVMLIDNYDLQPPVTQSLDFVMQQLHVKEVAVNLMSVQQNRYDIDDNHWLPFFDLWHQEGEYYTLASTNQVINKYPSRPPVLLSNVYLLDSFALVHKRSVYNFLFVLADVGGVQLILTLLFTFLVDRANDRKSMMSIVKKFFYVKAADPNFCVKEADLPGVYEFKIQPKHKANQCLYYFACCGYPGQSKDSKRYHNLLEQGEEKLHKYVNARHIMGVLDQHHKALQNLKCSGLEDKIFDYFLYLSSGDEQPDTKYIKATDNSQVDITHGNISANQGGQEFELESINEGDSEQVITKPQQVYRGTNSSTRPTAVSNKIAVDPNDNIERDYQDLVSGVRNSRDRTTSSGDDFNTRSAPKGYNPQRNTTSPQKQASVRKQPNNIGSQKQSSLRGNGNRRR